MSESIWWPEDPWWERKVLPLGLITLSFRQLGTIHLAFLAAFVVSLPFEFPIAGVSFGGRAAAFCAVFGVGYLVSNRRVKLLPVELQGLYFLRTNGREKVRMRLSPLMSRKNPEKDGPTSEERQPLFQEIAVEDFKNPLPLVVSDRVSDVKSETRAELLLDDQVRAEDHVSVQKPRYRLVYTPLPEDIGTHRLTVKLEGKPEPVVEVNLLLKGGSAGTNDSITRVR